MWGSGGKKAPGGYTDNIYRSRSTRGFESKSRCCCFYLTRSVLLAIVLTCLLGAGGLSVLACVFGYSQRWTYGVNRGVNPAYSVRTGWLYFSDNRMAVGERTTLKELGKATYILGIIALASNCLSTVLAALCAIRALCGRVGRGFICFSIPFSVLLIAVMLAYYIVTAFQVWKWSDRRVDASRVPWPDWAWAMGAGAAICWFIAAGVASVLPQRHKYYDAESEFTSPANVAASPYQPPARGTPINQTPSYTPYSNGNSYTPSAAVPAMANGGSSPMAAHEDRPAAEEGTTKKKKFIPTWSKKSQTSQELPNFGESGQGSYRSRAEEISARYKGKNKGGSSGDVELLPSAPAAPPKSAW